MSLIRWICSRLLDQVIPCPQVTGNIYIGCPNPSFPLSVVTVVVAAVASQAAAALARWQPSCQGAATPVAGAWLSPLRASRSRPCPQPSPLTGTAGLPFGLPLAAVGLGRGLAVGGRPYMGLAVAGRPSSLLPSGREVNRRW
ncbi:hypothetical protein GW17_00022664 [Ensete ventricosum]|nr:hypothetical protein GW17_00022664 [Ensete ventricosum]